MSIIKLGMIFLKKRAFSLNIATKYDKKKIGHKVSQFLFLSTLSSTPYHFFSLYFIYYFIVIFMKGNTKNDIFIRNASLSFTIKCLTYIFRSHNNMLSLHVQVIVVAVVQFTQEHNIHLNIYGVFYRPVFPHTMECIRNAFDGGRYIGSLVRLITAFESIWNFKENSEAPADARTFLWVQIRLPGRIMKW